MFQLGEGGRSIHELDKQRRRLQVDRDELQGALEEAEAALEQEENRSLRIQLELGQVRQEIDGRIKEKEEEFDNTRYLNHYIQAKTCLTPIFKLNWSYLFTPISIDSEKFMRGPWIPFKHQLTLNPRQSRMF